MAIPRSWHVCISDNIGLVGLLLGTRKKANSWPARPQYRSQNQLRAYFGTSSFPVFKAANAPFSDSEPHNPVQKFSTTYTETTFATLRHWKPLPKPRWSLHLVSVVQKVDSAIHWINLYPLNSAIGFTSTYPLDSDLSSGKRYPAFEQLGPGFSCCDLVPPSTVSTVSDIYLSL